MPFKKWVSMGLVLSVAAAALAACSDGGSSKENVSPGASISPSATAEPLMELSVYNSEFRDDKVINNPKDVVTPFVEQKLNIKITNFLINNNDQPFDTRLNQYIATNQVPDIVIAAGKNVDYAIDTGMFADLSSYLDKMPNHKKYFDAKFWPRFIRDGKKYTIPVPNPDTNVAAFKDAYTYPMSAHAMWAREDILKKAGYSFTPMSEIQKMLDEGKLPTAQDMQLTPAVDTPEKFYELLKKIKDLNLKVGDKPVMPLSMASWNQLHLGSMFDFGHWINRNGQADGWLGSPETKEYYKFLTDLYKENLIDKDFVIQKNEQLQEKVAGGRVAVGMWVPDINKARESIGKLEPGADIRYIPWPKKTQGKGYFDIYQGAYEEILIKKDAKDIDRIIAFIDWTYSDEGLDTVEWGPESAGLWKTVDGKRRFVNEKWNQYFLEGKKPGILEDGNSLSTYGLKLAANKIGLATGLDSMAWNYNPKAIERAYPPKLSAWDYTKNMLGSTGVNTDGTGSTGSGANVDEVSGYFWSKFQGLQVAKLLTANTDDKFNKAWDEVYAEFLKEGNYEAAKEEMKNWFEKNK
ncbi:hypothetical protein ACFO9Q_04980 [Paenibacillus sp. GCM10023252]|uniref:hypothetical protein n=1 Tax=Paenibacillus sp. GCM10023252 TaxID=3252649 RepID=UPI00360CE495